MAGDLTRVQSNGLLDASKSGLLNRDRRASSVLSQGFAADVGRKEKDALPLQGPWHEIAAYLALKPNVWVDISSMAFVYPTREFARILRTHLTFVPQKVLFGTDAGGSPGVPNDDVHHILLSRATRDALYLALAGLVQDGVVTEAQALEMGRGVIRGNARRLYGWK
jgi:predicted TIM-barrel fold metal-dependent hydrolase